jgi:hypothetical protein
MTSQSEKRTKIFVSYSHEDKRWLELLRVHLDPLEREYGLITWDDSRIRPGLKWKDEIRSALDSAGVAVLLVSPNFYSSHYIMALELPRLLKAAQDDGTLILPLLLSPSRFLKSELSQFQAANDPEEPLAGMTKVERDAVLNQIASRIEEWLTAPRGRLLKPTDDTVLSDQTIKREPTQKEVFPEEVFPVPERPDKTETQTPYTLFEEPRIAEETQPESKSGSRVRIWVAVIAVVLIAIIVGYKFLWSSPSPHNGSPPAQTDANEVKVIIKKGDKGTPLGDELVIELKDTHYDESSKTYTVDAFVRTPGYNEFGVPYQPVGHTFLIKGKSEYMIIVKAADQDSAEFLIKTVAN